MAVVAVEITEKHSRQLMDISEGTEVAQKPRALQCSDRREGISDERLDLSGESAVEAFSPPAHENVHF
jgi:hypothetical protein